MIRLRALASALVWVALIVVIALGAAGLVTAVEQASDAEARAQLTATGDAKVTALLDAATTDLAAISDDLDELGTQARGALAALNGADAATSQAAIAKGDRLVADISARTAALRASLASVPYVGTPTAGLTVSDPVAARHAALVAALDATDGLDVAWQHLTTGSLAATRMGAALAGHDDLVVKAAAEGVHARYPAALEFLGQASDQLTAAREIRDQLVTTVDVSVLDEWIRRNAAYDVALTNLYKEISKPGKPDLKATRALIDAEATARAGLPPDTRGLVVIMGEIGRGGMNGAVVTIEEARGTLADALDAIAPQPSDDAEPSDAP